MFLTKNKTPSYADLIKTFEREIRRIKDIVHEEQQKLRAISELKISEIKKTGVYYLIDDKSTQRTSNVLSPSEKLQKYDEYAVTVRNYLTNLEARKPQAGTKTDFITCMTTWCGSFPSLKVLIIDYENYKHSSYQNNLSLFIEANEINACIIISKSGSITELANKCTNQFLVQSTGLTLSKKDAFIHLLNAHDDLLGFLSYEICKITGKEPIIYSQDGNSKKDLLPSSINPARPYNYSHIPPFICTVTIITGKIKDKSVDYYIKPSEIELKGVDGKFDNYYHQFDPTPGLDNYYLQKYLKYKNKYMQLKKSIN